MYTNVDVSIQNKRGHTIDKEIACRLVNRFAGAKYANDLWRHLVPSGDSISRKSKFKGHLRK